MTASSKSQSRLPWDHIGTFQRGQVPVGETGHEGDIFARAEFIS